MFSDPLSILDSLGISVGMSVGDFGTGQGTYARELARRVGKEGVVYAFDVQKDLVTRLVAEAQAQKIDNLHVIWADLDEPGGTTLPGASLDVVIVANVLFQSEQKAGFLSEAVRVLRPNGRLLLVDWSGATGPLGPRADHVVTQSAAQALAEAAGLVFDRSVEAGEHHYGLLFRKS